MLTAFAGEIRDNAVVLDGDLSVYDGSAVIVTILDDKHAGDVHAVRRRRDIDLDSYSQRTERGQRAAEYVRELRDDDRI